MSGEGSEGRIILCLLVSIYESPEFLSSVAVLPWSSGVQLIGRLSWWYIWERGDSLSDVVFTFWVWVWQLGDGLLRWAASQTDNSLVQRKIREVSFQHQDITCSIILTLRLVIAQTQKPPGAIKAAKWISPSDCNGICFGGVKTTLILRLHLYPCSSLR